MKRQILPWPGIATQQPKSPVLGQPNDPRPKSIRSAFAHVHFPPQPGQTGLQETGQFARILQGKNHLSIKLIHQGNPIDAIWFSHTEPLPARVLLAFRLDVNEWKGERKVQFLVEGAQL